jgi:small subunit ribosomal protein S6
VPKKKKEPVIRDRKLQEYELVFVLNPSLAEEAAESRINSVSQYVTAHEGAMSDVQKWGQKKLAYPIKHFNEGNYVLAKFKMKPAHIKELEGNLRISEEVIRHLLIKVGS